MTELQQYLAEEVAEDHADGIITRREAVRRLGLVGARARPALGGGWHGRVQRGRGRGRRRAERRATGALRRRHEGGRHRAAPPSARRRPRRDRLLLRPRPAASAALRAARLKHRLLTFTEAGHAFFNDTGERFNAPAAEEAWRRVIAWFEEYAD